MSQDFSQKVVELPYTMIGFRPKTSDLYLERPRLLKLLPDSEGYVVWLEAPYGYGKSVLSSQWASTLEGEGWRVLWLSSNGRDLKAALAGLLDMPAEFPWENMLEALWNVPTLLVIEDLGGGEDLNPFLKDVRGLLLIASRTTLPYQELMRLKTQQHLIHLQAKQLAFTPEEAINLFDDKESAKAAWERSQGWSLPLHFAALTGENPEGEALLEGFRESLLEESWQEALFLSALPYLPFDTANEHSKDLARKGFAQELETGFRLHPLAAETIQAEYLTDIQQIVRQEHSRLPLFLQAEALARSQLYDELAELLENETENINFAAIDPQSLLRWDSLCPPERGPGRLLNLAYIQSVSGQYELVKTTYASVVNHPDATSDQKLTALGWWIFDLPSSDRETFQQLMTKARTVFSSATKSRVGQFLYNACAFGIKNQNWEEVEPMLQETLAYYQQGQSPETGMSHVANTLAEIRWELHGDAEQMLVTLKENIRVFGDHPYNAPVMNNLMGKFLALLSRPGSLHYFEQAETSKHNLAIALLAKAEKAAFLAQTQPFSSLVAAIKTWEYINPVYVDKVVALWAKTLRVQGQTQAALDVLHNASGTYVSIERALTLDALGQRNEALKLLPSLDIKQRRLVRIGLQAAHYLINRDEKDLDALLELTTSGKEILPALLPLESLPKHRPELSKVYELQAVLVSGWKEAIELRHHEIPDLELSVLGKIEVKALGKSVELNDRHKALLALMALGYNRETIGEALWPEVEGKKVSNNLHVQLNTLRKILEPWGQKTYLTEEGLARTKTDIGALREALEQQRPEKVVQLYHEPLAPGIDLPILDETRESLREEILECLFEAAQETADGVGYLERLLQLDPLHEKALQLLLEKLVERGRKREAVKRYQTFAAKLKTEMGLEPLEETRGLLN